jgi:anti-sigma regulatory factor (Ser/Thr protein kinase)
LRQPGVLDRRRFAQQQGAKGRGYRFALPIEVQDNQLDELGSRSPPELLRADVRRRVAVVIAVSDRAPHSEDAPTLRISLESAPQAPSLARAAVAGFTEEREIASVELATLTLLVSELVSNAVMHSDAPPASAILLRARLLDEGAIRVEVIDRGSGFTAIPRDPAQPKGGYGLYLVDKQATRWGVDREGGTRVWFEIAAGGRER